MADMSIGVPITFQVIRRLWPDHVNECMDFLAKNLQRDALMMAGIMHGGQQFLDYSKPGASGAPMGLARFMIEGDNGRAHQGDPPRRTEPTPRDERTPTERGMAEFSALVPQPKSMKGH